MTRRFVLVAAAVALVALLALGMALPAGISRDEAISAALRNAAGYEVDTVSASVHRFNDFRDGVSQQSVPDNPWVWAVVLHGRFPGSCGPAPRPGELRHACPKPPPQTELVILDYRTGRFIEGEVPSPL